MPEATQRLLIIDDDPSLLDVLAMALEDEGFLVSTARDGREGIHTIEAESPDLVICDVNMPKIDGFTLCRRLREAQNQVPFIMLTSRDNEVDEALGLELGADDYVAKPFSTRILVARVRSLLRREQVRARQQRCADAQLSAGDLLLDRERLEVRYLDEAITVTVTEFRLLEALARRPGIVFSRKQLLDRIRGDDSVVADRLVDTYVRRLRRKFEAVEPDFDGIETVIGAGYRWRNSP